MAYVILDNGYKLPFYESLSLKFSDSLRNYISVKQLDDGNVLVTSNHSKSDKTAIPLQRPSFCSFVGLKRANKTNLPVLKHKWVAVACVALLDSNERILLTRRSANMNAFPNVWVCPGGHVDPGERIEDTVFRELNEETGIQLSSQNTDITLLCAWESSFPALLDIGMPKTHHLVLYFKVVPKSNEVHLEKLMVSIEEVSAYCWVDKETVAEIIRSFTDPIDLNWLDIRKKRKINSFECYEIAGDNLDCHPVTRPLSVLTRSLSKNEENVERVSTGTKYALYEWLKSYSTINK